VENFAKGRCVKVSCGGHNQRPCLVVERIPSCDRGLREDFGTNRCVPLRPGETPFTAGLSSLTGEIAKGTQICEDGLSVFPQFKTGIKAADLGRSCHRNMTIGFVCAVPSVVQKISDSVELAHKIAREYDRSPCNNELTPAIFRSQCAVVLAVVRDADKAVNCLGAMIRTGLLPEAFRGKEKDMCLLAGEEAFLTTIDYLTGTIDPKSQIGRIIARIKQVNSAFNKASEANEFLEKVNGLRECRGVIGGSAAQTATYRPSPPVSPPASSLSAPAGSRGSSDRSVTGTVTPPSVPAYTLPPATAQPSPFPIQTGGIVIGEVAAASQRFRAGQALSVHEGPSPTAPAMAILEPGAEVEVTGRSGDWVRVALSDGRTGYVLGRLLVRSAPSQQRVDPGVAPPMPCIGGAINICCDDPELTYHARCQEWRPKYERWRQAYDAYHGG